MRLHFAACAALFFFAGTALAQTAQHKATTVIAAPTLSVDQMVAAANAEKTLLKSIYQAPTDTSLASMHPHSRIGAMVLAAKQYEFHPAVGGPAVIAALPRTRAEVEALHRFCEADSDIAGIERYFYGTALQSATTHPEKLTLVLHNVATSYAVDYPGAPAGGSWYCSELEKVRAALPQQYDRAAKQLEPGERAFLAECAAGS
jgi:hypothetical protein